MDLHRAGEHYPIKIYANDVIDCGGDINQSDFVGLRGSMWRSMDLCGGLCRSTRIYAGLGNIIQSKYVPMMSLAVVGTLTNQILWVYMGLHGSTQVYAEVYVGLCRGLHGSMWGW